MSVENLKGLVLAGGRSRRMGTSKAQLRLREDGRTQLEYTVSLLEAVGALPHLSVEKVPLEGVPAVPAARCIVDIEPNCGPLGGILAALRHDASALWLVVAVDLPLLTARTLQRLLDQWDSTQAFLAYRSATDGLPEPLCALYGPGARAILESQWQKGERSPRDCLKKAGAALIDLEAPDALTNLNSRSGLDQLRKRL
ncbi:MAG: molybdenum cofactor guanylyltransferase [Opitutales bacterium]